MLAIRQPSGARRAASAATQSHSGSPRVVSAVTRSWSSPMSRSFIEVPWLRCVNGDRVRPARTVVDAKRRAGRMPGAAEGTRGSLRSDGVVAAARLHVLDLDVEVRDHEDLLVVALLAEPARFGDPGEAQARTAGTGWAYVV